jgi:23S rRNA (uracil1939-C5)-methyltransferase
MLMHEGVNSRLAQLQGRCAETTQLSLRVGAETDDFLVQPRLKNPAIPLPTGQKHYLDSVDGRTFQVSSPSFFQVNTPQAARLAQAVRRALALTGGEVLLDAYTGVGAFAVLLAPHARKIIAIEESSAAVADARENTKGLTNVEFVLGKTEEVLAQLQERPDAAVLDPPRAGCQPAALRALVQLAPSRVAYVSCDPETLARDLKYLCGDPGPYILERVEPLDMFPQTYHVECVAVLSIPEGGLAHRSCPRTSRRTPCPARRPRTWCGGSPWRRPWWWPSRSRRATSSPPTARWCWTANPWPSRRMPPTPAGCCGRCGARSTR